jgi:hypothetical protein
MLVVVTAIDAQHMFEVASAEDEHSVEARVYRPRQSLNYMTPTEYARRCRTDATQNSHYESTERRTGIRSTVNVYSHESLLRRLVLDEVVEVRDDQVDALLLVDALVEVGEAPAHEWQFEVDLIWKLLLKLEREAEDAVVLRPEHWAFVVARVGVVVPAVIVVAPVAAVDVEEAREAGVKVCGNGVGVEHAGRISDTPGIARTNVPTPNTSVEGKNVRG